MKRTFLQVALACMLCLSSNYIFPQVNLIPNGDFELGPDSTSWGWQYGIDTLCGLSLDFVPGPTFWTVTSGTPDRFINVPCSGLPALPYSGDAHVLIAAGYFPPFTDLNEGGMATLNLPLQEDSIYRLGFYAHTDTSGYCWANTGPGRFLFRFNGGDSILFPFFYHPEWRFYDTIFSAGSISTEIELRGWDSEIGPYCAEIDSLFLERISLSGKTEFPDLGSNIVLYPNPASELLYIKTNCRINRIEIYDICGKFIMLEKKSPISLAGLPSGSYFMKIMTEKNVSIKKLFVIQSH